MPDREQQPSVRNAPDRKRLEIELGNGEIAFAAYTLPAGKIMFTHTEVPPDHEGEGLGTALIRFGLAMARERGLQVIPICPFFAAYFRKHPEEADILDKAYRKILTSS